MDTLSALRIVSAPAVVCLGLLAGVAACAPAAEEEAANVPTQADVRAEIAAVNEAFAGAFNAGDGAGVAALYTDDAVLYPPNAEPVSGGPDVLARFWQGVVDSGVERGILETVELEGFGDSAVEIGRYQLLGADGGTLDRGSFMVLWKRTDAGWRLHRDIWNSDLAPAP